MKCQKCGANISNGSKFCPTCGNKIEPVVNAGTKQSNPNLVSDPVKSMERKIKNVAIFGIVQAVIVSAIAILASIDASLGSLQFWLAVFFLFASICNSAEANHTNNILLEILKKMNDV